MRLGWTAKQIVAVVLFGALLVVVSAFLELRGAIRVELDAARAEAGIISRVTVAEVSHVVESADGDPSAAVAADRRIALLLEAANEEAPLVCYIAVVDAGGHALLHTTPGLVGTVLPAAPTLPDARKLGVAMRLIANALRGPAGIYEVVTPLAQNGRSFGAIRVGVAGSLVRNRASAIFRRTFGVAAVEIVLGIGVGFLLATMTRRRIAGLEAGVAALREGRFDAEIPVSGVDEFSRLARNLNLLSRQFQADREAQIGTFQRAVDLIGDGLMVLGPDHEVVLLNGLAGKLLDLSVPGARGKRVQDLLPRTHPVCRLVDRLRSAEERSLSIDLPMDDRGPHYAAIGHRLSEPDGPGGFLIEFRERAALQEMNTMVNHSRVLSRLGEMAAGVAHEIRNSLQTMHFELGILRESAQHGGKEIEDHVRATLNEVQRLENAVNGFLKVARLRSIQPAPLQPNELLSDIREVLDVEARLGGLELVLDLDESSPEVFGDREVIRQAIQNLVRNAIQAQPSADRRVVLATSATGGVLRMSVRDSGPGIPDEIRARVTDLYFTTREKGSGVGLAVARQAIEMHGGELEIDSTPGEGTTVSLRFPSRAEMDRRTLQEV